MPRIISYHVPIALAVNCFYLTLIVLKNVRSFLNAYHSVSFWVCNSYFVYDVRIFFAIYGNFVFCHRSEKTFFQHHVPAVHKFSAIRDLQVWVLVLTGFYKARVAKAIGKSAKGVELIIPDLLPHHHSQRTTLRWSTRLTLFQMLPVYYKMITVRISNTLLLPVPSSIEDWTPPWRILLTAALNSSEQLHQNQDIFRLPKMSCNNAYLCPLIISGSIPILLITSTFDTVSIHNIPIILL